MLKGEGKKRLEAGLVFWMKKEKKKTGQEQERVGDGISRTKKEREGREGGRDTKRE